MYDTVQQRDSSAAPFALVFLVALGLSLATSAAAQTVRIQNGSTLQVSNETVFRLEGGTMDFGVVGATARLDESGGGRVTGGTLQARRALDGPSDVNVAGLGAEITASADLGTVEVQRGHTVQTGGGNASIDRFYQIEPSGTNSSLDATLALHYAEAELNGLAESSLMMFRSTDQGSTWEQKGQDDRDTQNNAVQLSGIEAFSRWTLAGEGTPIPIELAAFEGTMDGEKVRLTWTTASETNNAEFWVQRKSDGANGGDNPWRTVGTVEGAGTTDKTKNYRFTDADFSYEADALTYRLKQVDTDGSTSPSDPVTVERAVHTVELLGIYPNPASQRAMVRYALPETQDVSVRLYDMLGRRVRTVADGEQEGRHKQRVDLNDLSSGVYFLRLRAGGQTRTEKLTVVQ